MWQALALLAWFSEGAAVNEGLGHLDVHGLATIYRLLAAFGIAFWVWVCAAALPKTGSWAVVHRLTLVGLLVVPGLMFLRVVVSQKFGV